VIFGRLWSAISDVLFGNNRVADSENVRGRAQASAPVVWLLGKTGAGKTAIVSALTGDSRAEVGEGFAPCTRTALFYDVPAEAPLLRFLDTRGIGEADYDPAKDIAWCEQQSHLLLAVMQVSDPIQEAVLRVLRMARRRHPDWPVVVAQTGLHRLYPSGMGHPEVYPYADGGEGLSDSVLPQPLRQALAFQRRMFEDLPGAPPLFVALDFTLPEDGFQPADFGIEALYNALEAGGLHAFDALHRGSADAESDHTHARVRPLIYGYGAASAGAGAVPIPLIGVGGFAGILALMLRTLAGHYGMAWTRTTFAQFSSAVGGGAITWWLVRYGFRELLKLVPIIGTTAAGALNAAAAFAMTVGVGEAACVWLGYWRRGLTAPSAEVRRAFAQGLAVGLRQAKKQVPNAAGASG
jgi:uncharacterized protein (DUF697 family)